MGMDVYGKNPTTEVGSYFRRNVWGWRPLWDYVEDQHPEAIASVEYGHSNDGDGLDEQESIELSALLEVDLASGRAQAYLDQRDAKLASIPSQPCEYCEGTGTRTDSVGIKLGMPERNYCNGCSSTGMLEPIEKSYYLDIEDIREFSIFLASCGGFEIC